MGYMVPERLSDCHAGQLSSQSAMGEHNKTDRGLCVSGGERLLLEQCVAGDKTAFEPIVTAYSTKAYHYAFSILHNHHDSLDVCQDAFVKAFRALKRFDLERPFLPWFMRVLRNVCLDELERRRRRPETPARDDAAEIIQFIPSTTNAPDAPLISLDEAGRIRNALSKLSMEQREVVFLRHFEDMSYATIAEVLDIPVGPVMSRLFNGRKALAKFLKSS